jgi:CelD/BcsL family acetyltransferase involved in cellulose biosynthesis
MRTEPTRVPSLEVRTYRTIEELHAFQPAWEDLLAAYPAATTFSTPDWLIPWWRNFGKAQQLMVAGFYDSASRLCAVAPLALTSLHLAKTIPLRVLRLMGDGSKDSDNLDLPVRPGFEEAFAVTLLAFLESRRTLWDFCEMSTLPPGSPGAKALHQLLQERTWAANSRRQPAAAIPLPATWEEYLTCLSSEDQKNLNRYARRLERRYAVHIYRCEQECQLRRCLESLFDLHQARWTSAGEPGSFGSRDRRDFYYELSCSLLRRRSLDLWVLELNGAIAAVQFGFRYGNRLFQLQEGNDPQHASDRVGFILRGHVIREVIGQGVRAYDFLGGEPGYKVRWGAKSAHYINLRFARPFTLGAVYLQGSLKARAAKDWLRRTLPQPVWRNLHNLNVSLRHASPASARDRAGSPSAVVEEDQENTG